MRNFALLNVEIRKAGIDAIHPMAREAGGSLNPTNVRGSFQPS